MDQFDYLVSICIPTYNRAEYLKKTLETIVVQEPFLDKKVEVVISDNASTDATEEICSAFFQKYSNISYHKNNENIRDENFPLVLSYAHGKLRRLSNDTMMYRDGALEHLCQLAEKNYERKPVIFLGMENTPRQNDIIDFHQAIRNISFWVTYIAGFCIWGDDCEGIQNDKKSCDLQLWQVSCFYRMALQKNQVLIDNEKLNTLQQLKSKNVSYGLYKVFYVNYLQILSEYLKSGQIAQEEYDYLEKDLLFHFFVPWIIKWESGTKNLNFSKEEDLKTIVIDICKKKPYWHELYRYYRRTKMAESIKRPLRFLKYKILRY